MGEIMTHHTGNWTLNSSPQNLLSVAEPVELSGAGDQMIWPSHFSPLNDFTSPWSTSEVLSLVGPGVNLSVPGASHSTKI